MTNVVEFIARATPSGDAVGETEKDIYIYIIGYCVWRYDTNWIGIEER